MKLSTTLELAACLVLPLSVFTAQAGSDDDKDKATCSARTLKGTYAFATNVNVLVPLPPFGFAMPVAFAGQIHFPGDGTATLQTTDNMGFGSGAAPHLTTVAGTVTQQSTPSTVAPNTGCVFDVAAQLLVTNDNCPLDVHLNVFAAADGEEFHAITTSATGYVFGGEGDFGAFYGTFEADRVSKRNVLLDLGLPLSTPGTTPGTCGIPVV